MIDTLPLRIKNNKIEIKFLKAYFDSKDFENYFYNVIKLPDGNPWLSIAKKCSCYIFCFNNIAEFKYDAIKNELMFHAITNVSKNTVEHLLYNQVVPYIYSYFGLTVLHSSAFVHPVQYKQPEESEGNLKAVSFLGDTGLGKSTLVGSFCADGFKMLTDDCLVTEEDNGQLIGYPGYPSLRLWSDSIKFLYGQDAAVFNSVADYTSKKRIEDNEVKYQLFDHQAPIERMYFLSKDTVCDKGRQIDITQLTPTEAFVALMRHSFNIDMTDPERVRRSFDAISGMARFPIYYRLSYPRDYDRLADVRQAILEHLNREQ